MTTTIPAAFDSLLDPRGVGLVSLAALRAAVPLDRAAFDRELFELRCTGGFVLHTFDGRHGKLTDEQRAAAIVEEGRTFVFAARR
jgi:hypothetical protein